MSRDKFRNFHRLPKIENPGSDRKSPPFPTGVRGTRELKTFKTAAGETEVPFQIGRKSSGRREPRSTESKITGEAPRDIASRRGFHGRPQRQTDDNRKGGIHWKIYDAEHSMRKKTTKKTSFLSIGTRERYFRPSAAGGGKMMPLPFVRSFFVHFFLADQKRETGQNSEKGAIVSA